MGVFVYFCQEQVLIFEPHAIVDFFLIHKYMEEFLGTSRPNMILDRVPSWVSSCWRNTKGFSPR